MSPTITAPAAGTSTARCGKTKSGWTDAGADMPDCQVCYALMQSGHCSHCARQAA